MKKEVGLWMDHRKAVIVAITDKAEETKVIISKVEKQLRRSGGSPLKGPHEVLASAGRRQSRKSIYGTSQHLLRRGNCVYS